MLPRNVQSSSMDGGSLQAVSWKALGPPITQQDAKHLLAEEMLAGRVPKVGEVPLPRPWNTFTTIQPENRAA